MSDLTPELNNAEEIERLLGSELQSQRDKGMGKVLQNVVVAVVNTRHQMSALQGSIHGAKDELTNLNKAIAASNESSSALSTAIKNITLAGAWIAGIGLLIAAANFILEIIKYLSPR